MILFGVWIIYLLLLSHRATGDENLSLLSITITSDPASPITEGTAVTLTCTVKLNVTLRHPPANLSVNLVKLGGSLLLGTPLSLTTPSLPSATFNYTVQVNSFGRNNDGYYACLMIGVPRAGDSFSKTIRVTTKSAGARPGVYVQLRGKIYSNSSISNIIINNIGEEPNSLICFTDLVDCCRSSQSLNGSALGKWSYPDGSTVERESASSTFYRNRDSSRVRLNRKENTTSPLGLFCCEVPGATYNVIRVCANIVSEFPSVTTTVPAIPSEKVEEEEQDQTEEEQDQSEEEQDQTEVGNTSMGITVAVVVTTVVILFTVIFATTLVVICLVRKRAKYGQSTQQTFQMSIRETPQINIISPHDVSVTEGKGVYFKVKVSGVPQPTVTWYHNGEAVKADYAREIEEDGSLAIPSTELKHSGVYKAVVTNQHGSEEREVKLTVDKNGKADTADHTYDTADCVNNHYEIIEKGTNQQLPSGDYQMTQCPVYGMAPRLPEMS